MSIFGKQEQEKIVVTIANQNPSFTFETHGDAMDLIDEALKNGHTIIITKKKVTS